MTKRVPGSIVALFLSTAVVAGFHLPIETIGSKFGGIPQGFPQFALPNFQAPHILPLLPSAFTVALLASVESLLSAVVADGMSGDHHNSNMELVAQGVANIVSPLFGGIPATGAIARTATNIRSGALTPVAGMVHALTLLAILLVAAPLARFVPLATLAAVLFVVAYNMGEWREIGTILRLSKTDIVVWFTTLALTVLADLTVAVGVGMALAALLYIYRIAETTTVAPVTREYLEDGLAHILQDKDIPSNVTILCIHGPFLFGTTEKLAEATKDLAQFGDVVILRLRNMTALDATGIHALEQFSDRLHKMGKTLLLCGAREQPSNLTMSKPPLTAPDTFKEVSRASAASWHLRWRTVRSSDMRYKPVRTSGGEPQCRYQHGRSARAADLSSATPLEHYVQKRNTDIQRTSTLINNVALPPTVRK
jgi:sulfate permease, SulP family